LGLFRRDHPTIESYPLSFVAHILFIHHNEADSMNDCEMESISIFQEEWDFGRETIFPNCFQTGFLGKFPFLHLFHSYVEGLSTMKQTNMKETIKYSLADYLKMNDESTI
jgi:hypothetical protein